MAKLCGRAPGEPPAWKEIYAESTSFANKALSASLVGKANSSHKQPWSIHYQNITAILKVFLWLPEEHFSYLGLVPFNSFQAITKILQST